MSEEWQKYVKDPRKICKYGMNCYQKNPEHHKNYKHPPKKFKRKGEHDTPNGKRFKPSPQKTRSPKKAAESEKDNAKGSDEQSDKLDERNDSTDDRRRHDVTATSESPSCGRSKSEDNLEIKLPENITYYNKDNNNLFKELFLVDMPKDFFIFFECLQAEEDFERILSGVNLQLIGPFDILMGKLPVLDEKDLYLIHWRFFYDPPEFQAVLKKKGKSEFHIGYFRDTPDAAPVFLASNDSAKGCLITPMAYHIFGAVYLYLQNEKKSSPFTSIACQKLMDKIKNWAEIHKYSLDEYNIKERLVQSVTKTFHRAGIVVPYDKKTELGYRKLVETDAHLKELFAKLKSAKSQGEKDKILSELQPVITYASIAVDECDFGTGLECGINLFCSGIKELQPSALSSLRAVYTLLNREAFAKIFEVHMKYRRKGPNMSILSTSESSS